MSNSASVGEPRAISRIRELLKAPYRDRPLGNTAGYLDLLDEDQARHSAVMVAMRMPLVTKIYERWWRPGLGWAMKGFGSVSMSDEYALASQLMRLESGSRVLDLACGPGNFSRRFARTVGPEGLVVGYDGSRPMLDRAVIETDPDATPDLGFVLGDASALPFMASSFDGVCCFAALHMFPDPFGSLDEIARVLKPGGRVVLLTSCTPAGKRGGAMKVLGPASGQRMFGRDEIREALAARGFTIEAQRIAGVAQIVGAKLG